MRTKTILAAIVGVGVVLAALGGAWYLLKRTPEAVCPLSGRQIHSQTRARADIGGKNYDTCCLRCAITEARQTGKVLQVLQIADYETGKLLDPEKAWYVEGSSVNPCMSMTPGAKRADQHSICLLGFDRCSPSVLGFSSEQNARAFIAQHGGVLKRLDKLRQESKSANASPGPSSTPALPQVGSSSTTAGHGVQP